MITTPDETADPRSTSADAPAAEHDVPGTSATAAPRLRYLYASTVIRGKKHGYIYKFDTRNRRVVRRARVRTDNPLAKHGGPCGIAEWGDRIVAGSYDTVHFFDRDLRPIRTFSHPLLSGIHGIAVDATNDRLWVTSCNNDAIACFDERGELVEAIHLEEDEALTTHFGIPRRRFDRAADYRRIFRDYTEQAFHVNHICLHPEGLLICLHKQGALWNLTRSRLHRDGLGRSIHDAQVHEGRLYVNDTGGRTLRVVESDEKPAREIVVQPALPALTRFQIQTDRYLSRAKRKLGKVLSWVPEPVKKQPWFLRGLAIHDARTVVAGMSPAALVFCEPNREVIREVVFLSHDLAEAVFAILSSAS